MLDDKIKEMVEDCFRLIKDQEKLIETLYKVNKELRNSNTKVEENNVSEKAYEIKYNTLKNQYLALEVSENKYKDMYYSLLKDANEMQQTIDQLRFNEQCNYESIVKKLKGV